MPTLDIRMDVIRAIREWEADVVFGLRPNDYHPDHRNAGKLVIVGGKDTIIGHIEFYPTTSYLDEIELSYHIYSSEHYGKGIATEAVQLMTGYLFNRLKVNRIRLIIHPDNLASQRVAAKSGFTHESTARGAWFHKGKSQDVEVFALLREEFSVK